MPPRGSSTARKPILKREERAKKKRKDGCRTPTVWLPCRRRSSSPNGAAGSPRFRAVGPLAHPRHPQFPASTSASGRVLHAIALVVATGAGSGYSPIASGTAGAAVGVLLFWPLAALSLPVYAATVVGSIGLAIWAAERMCQAWGTDDDGRIVADEIAGQLVTLLPLVAIGRADALGWVVTGFVLFRVFDVWKPGPVRWAGTELARRHRSGPGRRTGRRARSADARRAPVAGAHGGRDVKAEILTIGDELLRGEIVDSNKSFLSERLLDARHRDALPRDLRGRPRRHDRDLPARGRAQRRRAGLGRPRPDARRPHHRRCSRATFGRKLVLAPAVARRDPRLLRALRPRDGARSTRSRPGSRTAPRCSTTRSAPRPAPCSRCPPSREGQRALLLHARRAARALQDDGRAGAAADRVAAARHELGARDAAAHLRPRRVEPRRDAARHRAARRRRARLPHRSSRTTTCARSRARRARPRRRRSSSAPAR